MYVTKIDTDLWCLPSVGVLFESAVSSDGREDVLWTNTPLEIKSEL